MMQIINNHMNKPIFLIIFGTMLTTFNVCSGYGLTSGQSDNAMTQKKYEAAKRGQDKFHALLKAGDVAFTQGDVQQAERYFLEAYEFSQGSSSEAVARGKLARFYEGIGSYEKSLSHVNWFLDGLQKEEPSWQRYADMKARLVKIIEEQKNKSGSKTPIQNSAASDYARQKRFIESMQTKGVMTSFKEAALLEHAGKFADARKVYEKLLLQKDAIASEMTLESWVMLHPAIQRMLEVTGDEAREREMLVWIRENMLAEQGPYHEYLRDLLPDVQDHLKERLRKFGLV